MKDKVSAKDSQQEIHGELKVDSDETAIAILECLLFAATEPLSIARLARLMNGYNKAKLRELILQLQLEYTKNSHGLKIVEVAGGYQMATRAEYFPWLAELTRKKRRTGLSEAVLETLAIIAYKQPLTRAEVDAIRGVDSSWAIHQLLELGLIKVVGKKETPGRPQLYGTTPSFLKTFGLRRLSELPSIQELKEIMGLK